MTAIGPYVVVFWTLSRLVLVEKAAMQRSSSIPNRTSVEQAVTCSWVAKSPGHHASRRQLSHQGSTRVTGLHPKKVKQASKYVPCRHGDQVIGVRRSTYRCSTSSIGNKVGTLLRRLFGPKPVDSASKRLQSWANRGHLCQHPKNEMAPLVTFCIQIPTTVSEKMNF